jgi:hypothetical protein
LGSFNRRSEYENSEINAPIADATCSWATPIRKDGMPLLGLTALKLGVRKGVSNEDMKMSTSFKNDFLSALRARENYDGLMVLVRRYRAEGLSVEAVYEVLQQIWQEHGFDMKAAEEGTLQDTLEAVMEKVWYGQPAL